MYYLEKACKQQLLIPVRAAANTSSWPQAQDIVAAQTENGFVLSGQLAWPGNLRKLERESPGYDA